MPDKDIINWHIQRMEVLRTNRSNFDSQWEEAARRVMPAHVSTFFSRGRVWTKGAKQTQDVITAEPALALQRFSSVMESLATPTNQQWHRLVPSNPELRKNRQVRLYLDDLTRRLFQERYSPRANFVGQNQKSLLSYGAYGNGILFLDSNPEGAGGVRYKNLHLGQCYFEENHQGIVDTMYRTFTMKPRQIIREYGVDGLLPESIFKLAKEPNTSDTDYDLIHVIVPREEIDPNDFGSGRFPFESITIFVQERTLIRSSGYSNFPAAVARFMQFTGETYGRGPTQLVLPAIKVLNEQKKTVLKQGHRITDPVLLAYDDGALGTFSLRAGAVNPGGVNAQGRALIQPLPTGNIAVGVEMMEMEQKQINDAYLVNLFLILTERPQMTATEALELMREKGLLIAPTAGRLQSEYLGPMIEREIGVLALQGKLPEPPGLLLEAGGQYEVQYDSPMSRMMRAENASGFARSLDTTANAVKLTGDVSMMDHFNFDVAIPELNDINGVPTAWTASPEQVAAKRKARADAQQQKQMLENAQGLASAAGALGLEGSDLAETVQGA